MARTKTITSRDNPTIKALRALAADAHEQRCQGRTILEGPHLLETYLQRVGLPELVVVSDAAEGNAEIRRLQQATAMVETLSIPDRLFRELSGVANPVGISAVIRIPPSPSAVPKGMSVVLDAVQDAGNVGTIIRTAAAAGVREVVLGPGCAGAWTPKVLRAAQGAHFGLNIREQSDLAAMLASYSGIRAVTVARGGKSLYQLDLSHDIAWVFGNEGAGVSPDLAKLADHRVTIPLAPGNESLNVAAAAAVCLFEAWRQHSNGRVRHG